MIIRTQQRDGKMCSIDSLMAGRIVANLTASLGKTVELVVVIA